MGELHGKRVPVDWGGGGKGFGFITLFYEETFRHLPQVVQQSVESSIFGVVGGGGAFFNGGHDAGVKNNGDRDTVRKAFPRFRRNFLKVGKADEAGAV
ncbi:MAG: hypothetical protein A2Y89_05235 [Chloroflexi bacterium RBG_13_51_18]|nr:MAG: hypothetical protein A2Y89_05235 [Chloroflexi bacterium RBG_13_51_18]